MDLQRQGLEWFLYKVALNYNNEPVQNFDMMFYVLTCCIHFSLNGPTLSNLNKEDEVLMNVQQ
jgi:hypothetical protein